jgi:glutaconyl-CoA decarboxylase
MREFEYEIGGTNYKVTVESFNGREATIRVNGETYEVALHRRGNVPVSAPSEQAPSVAATAAAPEWSPAPAARRAPVAGSNQTIVAPMPGVVLEVKVKAGDAVKKGDVLLVLEAMKMENEIRSGCEGKIKSIKVGKGDRVNTGDPMISFE